MAAQPAHLPVLAEHMRAQERDECAALGYTPEAALALALGGATLAWTGTAEGEPVCMFGVTADSFVSRVGRPWLLSTDGVLRHQHAFLRRNRAYIETMLAVHPRLADKVDDRNSVSIRWLRWLGFRIGEPVPWGLHGELFRPFEMEV